MIDFFASATIALIIIMTVVIFISNQHQAQILKQMRLVFEDWYQAQMRDRREAFKKEIRIDDILQWVGSQVGLTVVEQGRKLENPQAVEFLTTEGIRLVISPLPAKKLRSTLRSIEGKRRKVAKLVEPLLGSKPGKVQIVERSNRSVHEWYEVEIEAALEKMELAWTHTTALYFYMIPTQPEKQHTPLVSFDMDSVRIWFKNLSVEIIDWLKQQNGKNKKKGERNEHNHAHTRDAEGSRRSDDGGIRSHCGSLDPGSDRGIHEPGLDHCIEDQRSSHEHVIKSKE
jgi:hypothetical protein